MAVADLLFDGFSAIGAGAASAGHDAATISAALLLVRCLAARPRRHGAPEPVLIGRGPSRRPSAA